MNESERIRVQWLWQPSKSLAGLLLEGPDLSGAACTGDRAYLFDDRRDLIDKTESPTRRERRHEAAQQICYQKCPVRLECLAARLADTSLGPGVWGGQLFETDATNKICPCGALFTTANKNRRYCTDECREMQQEQRRQRSKAAAA